VKLLSPVRLVGLIVIAALSALRVPLYWDADAHAHLRSVAERPGRFWDEFLPSSK
jgi:hypothetical protein